MDNRSDKEGRASDGKAWGDNSAAMEYYAKPRPRQDYSPVMQYTKAPPREGDSVAMHPLDPSLDTLAMDALDTGVPLHTSLPLHASVPADQEQDLRFIT